jgi:hypothetical protein
VYLPRTDPVGCKGLGKAGVFVFNADSSGDAPTPTPESNVIDSSDSNSGCHLLFRLISLLAFWVEDQELKVRAGSSLIVKRGNVEKLP